MWRLPLFDQLEFKVESIKWEGEQDIMKITVPEENVTVINPYDQNATDGGIFKAHTLGNVREVDKPPPW